MFPRQFVPRPQWNIFVWRKMGRKCFHTNFYLGSGETFLLEENWVQNVFTSLCYVVKNIKVSKSCWKHAFISWQQTFTCLKSTMERLEKGVKYVQS